MPKWVSEVLEQSSYFMPHGHCYLWIPSLLWLHVISDTLIGISYLGISLILYILVRKIRLPFSPVFIAFGLFIALCGVTHFMKVWTVWNPDYVLDGVIKAATAAASVATAIALFFVKPQVEAVVHAARLSEERRIRLESTHAELAALYEKVKDMDALKTQFFANVSHELRTPLALILGPAEKMLDDSNLTQDQRRQLQSISRNGKTLLKQVNDLLDISRLEAGKMPVQYARLDLIAWLRQIAARFEMVAGERDIRFQLSAPDTLHAEVDPDMLERIFINLLSNAFKFTPNHGEIHVALEQRGRDEFSFVVADTGPGIQADQYQAIFERFRQADGSATRSQGGTGLGLAIVKDFVDLHGGRIEVGTAAGGGAMFTVHLPMSAPSSAVLGEAPQALVPMTQVALDSALQELAAAPAGAPSDASWPYVANRPAVLVVEDNREMRHFVASILGEDYNVVTASDGQEGLERALALQPDMIVTDIMMPRMSGDQLVAALRARSEFAAVPILLLTAKADDALRVKLLQNGAQDYLTKPFLTQELKARTGNLVAMKRSGDTLRVELASLSGDLEGLAKELSIKHRQLKVALETTEVAREQAEQATRVKSQFLAMVSHELRTPLSTMHMNLHMLTHENKVEQLPDFVRPGLGRLSRATQQMSTLIEGLLEYTRIESGRLITHPESTDVVALSQDVIDAHQENIPSGVQLMLAAPSELAALLSDPRLLRVALSNLVANALKFTHQGTVTIRLQHADGVCMLDVQDTGIGIPEVDMARMFLPFEQLEPVQRKSIPGVGLGLTLVKQIVEALGGELVVSSTVGIGSTFSIRLPSQQHSTRIPRTHRKHT